ncbi:MAG TPA: hypothetical protein VIG06_26815 [Kofleriaceae bacterium]|jgi:hypothetical protein
MRLVGGFLIGFALCSAGCGGRQAAGPARAASAERPPARRKAAPTAAAPSAEVAAPAPANPTPEAPQASADGSVFVPTATDQVFVRRMLDVIDEVATVIDRQQDACDRMATDLEGVLRRNQDLIFMAKQMKGNPARDKWMQEQAMERLQKALPRMMAGFQKCQNDTRMQALIRQLSA